MCTGVTLIYSSMLSVVHKKTRYVIIKKKLKLRSAKSSEYIIEKGQFRLLKPHQ